jgi:hypothetical protein
MLDLSVVLPHLLVPHSQVTPGYQRALGQLVLVFCQYLMYVYTVDLVVPLEHPALFLVLVVKDAQLVCVEDEQAAVLRRTNPSRRVHAVALEELGLRL